MVVVPALYASMETEEKSRRRGDKDRRRPVYRQPTNAWRFRFALPKFCSVALRKTSPCVERCLQLPTSPREGGRAEEERKRNGIKTF